MTRPCRSCGAQIGFVVTPAGRYMPVDPDLVSTLIIREFGEGKPITLVTERGQIVQGHERSVTDPAAEAVEGYVPHWKTCTNPSVHRRTS